MKALFLFIVLSFHTLGFAQETASHEYMTITQAYLSLKISQSEKEIINIDLRGEMSNDEYDFKPLLKRIEMYEEEGWELVSNQVYSVGGSSTPINYVLMRRKKSD